MSGLKNLCDRCEDKPTCTKLCGVAEKYVNQDAPEHRPGHLRISYWPDMDSLPGDPPKNLDSDISEIEED